MTIPPIEIKSAFGFNHSEKMVISNFKPINFTSSLINSDNS